MKLKALAITVLTADNKHIKIRLYGIDCPGTRQPFGVLARQTIMDAIFEEDVTVQPLYQDRFGRTVAVVGIGGETLQEILVRDGMAWVYPKYCTQEEICNPLRNLEKTARVEKRGLWADKNPVPPWVLRSK